LLGPEYVASQVKYEGVLLKISFGDNENVSKMLQVVVGHVLLEQLPKLLIVKPTLLTITGVIIEQKVVDGRLPLPFLLIGTAGPRVPN
jgi:hypothetical protein